MSRDEVISDILLNWEELREQGQEPALEELCRDHPEVRGEVERRIRALRKMYRIPNAAQAPTQPVGSRPFRSNASLPSCRITRFWNCWEAEGWARCSRPASVR